VQPRFSVDEAASTAAVPKEVRVANPRAVPLSSKNVIAVAQNLPLIFACLIRGNLIRAERAVVRADVVRRGLLKMGVAVRIPLTGRAWNVR
jgi:hypothetical protein